jgi:hypothetical protein
MTWSFVVSFLQVDATPNLPLLLALFSFSTRQTILGVRGNLQIHSQTYTMSDDEDIAALVIDNGSGMCKGMIRCCRLSNSTFSVLL